MFRRSYPLVRQLSRSAPDHQARNIRSWFIKPAEYNNTMRDLEREMDDFGRELRHIGREMERKMFSLQPLRYLTPRLIPIEGLEQQNSEKFCVNVDTYGFKPEDFKISLKDGVMKIEANMEKTDEDGSKIHKSFMREFTVPENLNVSTVESFLHNDGTLRIEGNLKVDEGKKIPISHDGKDEPPALK